METLKDLMQMTSDGFLRLENRMDSLEGQMSELQETVSTHSIELKRINDRLESLEEKLDMHNNDIKDILIILDKLTKKVDLSEEERKLAAATLQHLLEWAHAVAKKINVPLKPVS